MAPDDCATCWGCGQLANSKKREPWVAWTQLPVASAAAIFLGIVRPEPCPDCGGTGKNRETARAADVEKHLDPENVTCPSCLDRGWVHKTLRKMEEKKHAGTLEWNEVNGCAVCTSCFKLKEEEARIQHALICGCPLLWIDWDGLEASP